MIEKEIKILDIEQKGTKAIIKKLTDLGAKKILDAKIESFYFDYPNNSLASKNISLRLRIFYNQENHKEIKDIVLTLKKPQESFNSIAISFNSKKNLKQTKQSKLTSNSLKPKIRQEFETKIYNLKNFLKIMDSLGLKKKLEITKYRMSYLIERDNVRFDFDKYFGKYSYIPEFLEIEAKRINTIKKYIKILGLTELKCVDWSFKELIKYYKNK